MNTYIEEAIALRESGKHDASIKRWKALIQQAPGNGFLHCQYGLSCVGKYISDIKGPFERAALFNGSKVKGVIECGHDKNISR